MIGTFILRYKVLKAIKEQTEELEVSMTVQELINRLETIEDKTKPVYYFDGDYGDCEVLDVINEKVEKYGIRREHHSIDVIYLVDYE